MNTHQAKAKCKVCHQEIVSNRGGEFVYCLCQKSFIDQERYEARHVRLGGEAEFIEQICPETCKLENHKDNKKSSL